MKLTGQILKENREKQRISLQEVSSATKINIKILDAIEGGRAEDLPPKTFVRGFVRTYASFLKLDVEKVLETFTEEMGTTKPKTIVGPLLPDAEAEAAAVDSANRASSSMTTWFLVGGAILLVVGIFITVKTIEKYERESVIEMAEPSATPAESPAPSQTMAPAAAVPSSSPTVTATPPPTAIATATATAKPTVAPTPASTPKPTPVATPKPTPISTPKPTPTASAVPIAASPKPAEKVGAQEIILEALDAIEVQYQLDSTENKTVSLKPEQVYILKFKTKASVQISDGGAVNVSYNGTDKGVPGNLGQPIKLQFP